MTNDPPLQSSMDQPLQGSPRAEQPPAEASSSQREEHQSLLQSRGAVLSFVFLVAGVVGLPLLWMNPNFSRGERVAWTVIVLLYSITLLILAGGMVWWIYRQLFGI
jgi:hypothetical protein